MLDRRMFLGAGAASGALLAFPAWAVPAPEARHSRLLNVLFDELFQEQLRQRPESATQLGLDEDSNADLRARLSDLTPAGRAAAKARTPGPARRLLRIDPATL